MLELASLGAKVLHNRSVELAKKYNINLTVRSSFTEEEGTVVKGENFVEKMLVNGIAVDKDVAVISITGLKDLPGVAFNIFSALSKHKISVDIILQTVAQDGSKEMSFTVSKSDLKQALQALQELEGVVEFKKISYDENVSKISIVGAGMATNSGVASRLFEAVYTSGVNIKMISTSEIKISILVDEKDCDRVANNIHDKFIK